MRTKEELIQYIQTLPIQLQGLKAEAKPIWGKMNGWEMVEHLALTYKPSNGKLTMPLSTPVEKVDKYKNIGLLSDRPIAREFDNPVLGEWKAQNPGMRTANINEAVAELQQEIQDFMNHFNDKGDDYKRMHNIFGELNFHEWLWFHYKHTQHHFMQFELVPVAERII